jgi:hypothetical protein
MFSYDFQVFAISFEVEHLELFCCYSNAPCKAFPYEMSNINYAYNGRKYTYGYMVKNFDRADPNAITKVRKLALKPRDK